MPIYFDILIFLSLLLILFTNIKSKQKYGRKIKKIDENKKVVIDVFTYFQESLMLSIRLFRMNEYVDYFLIILSNTTFSGMPLNISFSPFESYIKKYNKKIILYNISDPSFCSTTWCREKYQRNSAINAIKALRINNESIIIISDLDEIPTSDAMKYIIKNPPKELYMLSGYMYYYNYRHKLNEIWPGIIVIKASNCHTDIDKYRGERYSLMKTHSIPINPSLSHCSYCYRNISFIQKKLSSFSHSEFNKPPYTSRDYIMKCIKTHQSLFGKNKFEVVKYNEKLLPLPNDDRFKFLKEEYDIL